MRDTESLHPFCWRGTYSYGKSLNVLVLAVLDDLLQSVVVMWFSISHYDHDLFNAPPGTPGFSECLFPEGNTDWSNSAQSRATWKALQKYINSAKSGTSPPDDRGLRCQRHAAPWSQLQYFHSITRDGDSPYYHLPHMPVQSAGASPLWMLHYKDVVSDVSVGKNAHVYRQKWSLGGGDHRQRNKDFLFFAYLQQEPGCVRLA